MQKASGMRALILENLQSFLPREGGGGVPGLGLYLWKNPGSHTSRKVNVV